MRSRWSTQCGKKRIGRQRQTFKEDKGSRVSDAGLALVVTTPLDYQRQRECYFNTRWERSLLTWVKGHHPWRWGDTRQSYWEYRYIHQFGRRRNTVVEKFHFSQWIRRQTYFSRSRRRRVRWEI